MAMRIISQDQITPHFYIKTVPIYGNLILAPMAGYSDSPNRLIARRLGSAMSYTEFVNAIDITQDIRRVSTKLTYLPEERPVVFQVFDNDLGRILSSARILFPLQPDILDINLGCSAHSVSNRGSGAGLLKNPKLIADIFTQLVKISPIPVTAKIRLGWDDDSRNYLEVSHILEECGAALIAVHGRTKKQAYNGRSDWQAIAEVKANVKIPVLANGDVCTPDDITNILSVTGCDGVMIGRGSFGNPWIFSRLVRDDVTLTETLDVIWQHLELIENFYGSERGYIIFRKHLKAYLLPFSIERPFLYALMTAENSETLHALIMDIPLHIQGA